MLDERDIRMIKERMVYEESFFSCEDTMESIDNLSDELIEEKCDPEKSFDYGDCECDEEFGNFKEPVFQSLHEMEIYYYTGEDECWCDEYEPEYDPFDSLDEPFYDF